MHAKIPAYARVYNALKARILESDYAVGELLPPEPELEKQFGVSRTTVRKAVENLSREGFVLAQQGRGTQVLDFSTRQNLNEVTSLSETLERKGFTVVPKSMYIDRVAASAKLAKELEVEVGAPVVRVQRIQLADGKPIAIMHNYLRAEMVPGMENDSGKFHRLYDYLETRHGIVIDSAYDRITAKAASFTEAEMLQVSVGSALIYLIRNCFSAGKPVCADHCSIIGGRYDFEIRMQGRYRKPRQSEGHGLWADG